MAKLEPIKLKVCDQPACDYAATATLVRDCGLVRGHFCQLHAEVRLASESIREARNALYGCPPGDWSPCATQGCDAVPMIAGYCLPCADAELKRLKDEGA